MNTYYVLGSEASVANTMTAESTLRKLTDRGVYLRRVIVRQKPWMASLLSTCPPFHSTFVFSWVGQDKKQRKRSKLPIRYMT